MGKKKNDSFYFDSLTACAECGCKAAHLLDDIVNDFDPDALEGELEEMHGIEEAADERNHEISDALMTAFITPIEREDIDLLSHSLDEIVDHVEGVLHRIYFGNIREMRPEARELSALVVRACEAVRDLMAKFPDFKKHKRLHELIIQINAIEEETDNAYMEAMRELHTTETDPMQVIAWRDVYEFFELCADSCEAVARVVDDVVMKNS